MKNKQFIMGMKAGIPVMIGFIPIAVTFAIFTTRNKDNQNKYFFAGLALVTYLSWIGGTVFGSIAVHYIPKSICNSMSIALYAMFIGLLVPSVKENHEIIKVILITVVFVNCIKLNKRTEKFMKLVPYTAMSALIIPGILSVNKECIFVGIIGGLTAIILSIKKVNVIFVIGAAVRINFLLNIFI